MRDSNLVEKGMELPLREDVGDRRLRQEMGDEKKVAIVVGRWKLAARG